MEACLAREGIMAGGALVPIPVAFEFSQGTGIMNPSIYLDGDKLLCLIRHTNYVLYHAEKLKFPHTYGPLQYLHPENYPHLSTDNFIAELDKETLEIMSIVKVDTSAFDRPSNAMFIGLEDARLFRWAGKLFGCGVRRDVDPNAGRMELSELNETYKEVARMPIHTVGDIPSYVEKNWIPVLDEPGVFVKWMNPVEIVKVEADKTATIHLGKTTDMPFDFRGGSQVITHGEYRLAIVHETHSHTSPAGNKNATYRHRIVVFDRAWSIVKYSDLFNFMEGEIEFCCGLASLNGSFLLSFGFQDNAAYVLRVPEQFLLGKVGL